MSQYQTGTANVIQGNTTVTGNGTQWLTDNNIQVGNIFLVNGSVSVYFISNVIDNETISLTAPYGGVDMSAVTYAITRDFTPEGIPLMNPKDLGSVAIYNQSMIFLNSVYAGGGTQIGNQTQYGSLKLSNSVNSVQGVDDGTASTPAALKSVRESLEVTLTEKMNLAGGNSVTQNQTYTSSTMTMISTPVHYTGLIEVRVGDAPASGINATGGFTCNTSLALNSIMDIKDLSGAVAPGTLIHLNGALQWFGMPLVNNIQAGANVSIDNSTPGQPIISATPSTSAGISNRIYLSAETEVVDGTTYFKSIANDKGSVPSGSPTPLSNGDDIKQFYDQDVIGISQPTDTIIYAGAYTGFITVQTAPSSGEQRWGAEIYLADSLGTPVTSGISGAPIGDLGVAVIAILDTGVLDMVSGELTVQQLTGSVAEQVIVPTGYRVLYHFWAEKIGTVGGSIVQEIFYGSNHVSYLDAPAVSTSDTVVNLSTLPGATVTDALNSINSESPFNFFCGNTATVHNTIGHTYLVSPDQNNQPVNSTTNTQGTATGQINPFPRGINRQVNEIVIEAGRAGITQAVVGANPIATFALYSNTNLGQSLISFIDVPVEPSSIIYLQVGNSTGSTGTNIDLMVSGLTIAIPDDSTWGLMFLADGTTDEDISLLGQFTVGIKGTNL